MENISIIMCAFNSEDTISEAIESVLNQTIENFEFIIINDGSTDETLSRINFYKKTDKRIKIISQNNLGAGLSRNRGIKVSSGKYIAFIDADDIWIKNKLELQIQVMKENADADIVVTDMISYDAIKRLPEASMLEYKYYPDFFEQLVLNNLFFQPTTAMIKRELFNLAMYTQDHSGQDYYPFLMFALHEAKLFKISVPLYGERSLQGSLQRSARSKHLSAIARHKAIKSILENSELYSKFLTELKIDQLKFGNDRFLGWSAYTARHYMPYLDSLKFIINSYCSFYKKRIFTLELIKTLLFPIIKLKLIFKNF